MAVESLIQVGVLATKLVVWLVSSAMIPVEVRERAASVEPRALMTAARWETGTAMPSWPQPLKELSGSFMGLR